MSSNNNFRKNIIRAQVKQSVKNWTRKNDSTGDIFKKAFQGNFNYQMSSMYSLVTQMEVYLDHLYIQRVLWLE